jgi:hypothetical protein
MTLPNDALRQRMLVTFSTENPVIAAELIETCKRLGLVAERVQPEARQPAPEPPRANEAGIAEGMRMCAEFLEREADANFMPNEPTKVLIKGLATAIRVNMKAFAIAATPEPTVTPAPNELIAERDREWCEALGEHDIAAGAHSVPHGKISIGELEPTVTVGAPALPVEIKQENGDWYVYNAGYKVGPFRSHGEAAEWVAKFRPARTSADLDQQAANDLGELVMSKAPSEHEGVATARTPLPKDISLDRQNQAVREALKKGKVGWMDSIDFHDELGHALGGNLVFPDKEDCERIRTCIKESQEEGQSEGYPCYAKRVVVFDADELEAALQVAPAQVSGSTRAAKDGEAT